MPCEIVQDFAFRPNLANTHLDRLLRSGYSCEQAKGIIAGILERDLAYYFLEQFAKENLVHFQYRFTKDLKGEQILVSPNYEKLGDVCGLYKNAIAERKQLNKPVDREEAELEGMEAIKERLSQTDKATNFLLVSSPPPVSERDLRPGYGDYSFIFFGKFDPKTKQIDMFALRNNLSVDQQVKIVNRAAGQEVISRAEAHPNDFLRRPVFTDRSMESLIGVVEEISGHKLSLDFDKQIWTMERYSEHFGNFAQTLADLIAEGADEKTLQFALAAIEMEFVKWINGEPVSVHLINYKMDEVIYGFGQLAQKYDLSGFMAGSCGASTISTFGRDNFSIPGIITLSLGPDLLLASENYFDCPKCQGKIKSGLGITTCPHCGYTKEEAARELRVSC